MMTKSSQRPHPPGPPLLPMLNTAEESYHTLQEQARDTGCLCGAQASQLTDPCPAKRMGFHRPPQKGHKQVATASRWAQWLWEALRG